MTAEENGQGLRIEGTDSLLQKALENYLQENFDKYTESAQKQIHEKVQEEAKKLRPKQINIPERKSVQLEETTHKAFNETLFLAQQERQIYLKGPAGSGKTMLAAQIAKSMNLRYAALSVTAGMSEAHLLGRMVFDGSYIPSPFVDFYENGGVFLLDEVDAADPNTLLVINSAISNSYMSVPNRKEAPYAKRHKDFIVIASANTWGNGSIEYSGREMQDTAFMDRFSLSKVEINYDDDLEEKIAETTPDVLELFRKLRERVEENSLERVVSTRAIESAVNHKNAGYNLNTIFNRFTLDWEESEKEKVKDIPGKIDTKKGGAGKKPDKKEDLSEDEKRKIEKDLRSDYPQFFKDDYLVEELESFKDDCGSSDFGGITLSTKILIEFIPSYTVQKALTLLMFKGANDEIKESDFKSIYMETDWDGCYKDLRDSSQGAYVFNASKVTVNEWKFIEEVLGKMDDYLFNNTPPDADTLINNIQHLIPEANRIIKSVERKLADQSRFHVINNLMVNYDEF